MKEIRTLSALDQFQCLSSACPLTCCQGQWNILIDNETEEKWNSLSDKDGKHQMVNFITLDEETGKPVMKKNELLHCGALNSEKLCNIHLQRGPEYMPAGCKAFPKLQSEGYYRSYHSASFACPEIVDKVLFGPITPLFNISQNSVAASDSDAESEKYEILLKRLDDIIAGTISDIKNPPGLALKFISDVCNNVMAASESTQEISQIVVDVELHGKNYLAQMKKAYNQGVSGPDAVMAGWYWHQIYSLCIGKELGDKYLADYASDFGRTVKAVDGSAENYAKLYFKIKQFRKAAKKLFKTKYNILMRRYLQVNFANHGIPVSPRAGKFDVALVFCMINISVLQLLLWIQLDKTGKLNNSIIQDCILQVSRRFLHSHSVIEKLKSDPQLMQIHQYSECFVDLF